MEWTGFTEYQRESPTMCKTTQLGGMLSLISECIMQMKVFLSTQTFSHPVCYHGIQIRDLTLVKGEQRRSSVETEVWKEKRRAVLGDRLIRLITTTFFSYFIWSNSPTCYTNKKHEWVLISKEYNSYKSSNSCCREWDAQGAMLFVLPQKQTEIQFPKRLFNLVSKV